VSAHGAAATRVRLVIVDDATMLPADALQEVPDSVGKVAKRARR
jgi:DNA transposition AAA+ family ATPase